jgi:hypothetical protein
MGAKKKQKAKPSLRARTWTEVFMIGAGKTREQAIKLTRGRCKHDHRSVTYDADTGEVVWV